MKRGWQTFRGKKSGLDLRPTGICRRVQDLLAERGPSALRTDDNAQLHLEGCEACFRELEAFAALDAGFGAMPRLDAPDDLVESLLQREELQPPTSILSRAWFRAWTPRQLPWLGRPRLRLKMAVGLLALISLSTYVHQKMEMPAGSFGISEVHGGSPPQDVASVSVVRSEWVGAEANITFRGSSARIEPDISGPFDNDDDERARVRERLRERLSNLPRGLKAPAKGEETTAPEAAEPETIERLMRQAAPADVAREQALQFLAERDSLEVASQPAEGSWSNSYVPDDPEFLRLQARLNDRKSALLRWSLRDSEDGSSLRLHNGALRPEPPFDPPRQEALALGLTSDRAALEGESRLLVQVALASPTRRIDRESADAGLAVAQKIRLQIKLAPGVRLIDVVGARRHDTVEAERIREPDDANNPAIEQRWVRHRDLGADHGDDGGSLQIAIPKFNAGDHHAVLLDVIASGPGLIAEVSVGYADLMRGGYTTVRSGLALPAGEPERGPRGRHVLKNLLAHQLHDVLADAGQRLAAGDLGAAAEQLSRHRLLLGGLQSEVADWNQDGEIRRDLEMLDEYLNLLDGQRLARLEHREYVADSLRYAALRKILPIPSSVARAG